MAKMGEVHFLEFAFVLKTLKGEMVSEVLKWGFDSAGKNIFDTRSESVRERTMLRYDYETSAVSYRPDKSICTKHKIENVYRGFCILKIQN